jgi:hypothetical protein
MAGCAAVASQNYLNAHSHVKQSAASLAKNPCQTPRAVNPLNQSHHISALVQNTRTTLSGQWRTELSQNFLLPHA